MNSKIELYKEVLAFEPTSKVFFPLSRLLWEEGDLSEAVRTLRTGLASHPDHLEARFMLIELLSRLNQQSEAEAAFAGLTSCLTKYPSFWNLWAKNSGGLSQDSNLALSFLAAAIGGADVSFSKILQLGLAAMSGVPAAAAPKSPEPVLEKSGAEFSLRGAKEVSEIAATLDDSEALPEQGGDVSLKTRTMASLLAEQGEYESALEIYEQLAAKASGQELTELKEQAAIMRDKLGTASSGPAEEASGESGKSAKGKAKLLNMLEALAGRLEARAQAQ